MGLALRAELHAPRGLPRHDLGDARIPREGLAVLTALRFDHTGTQLLRELGQEDLLKVLRFCDPAQLTLTLDSRCHQALPNWVRDRIARNRLNYSRRFARLIAALEDIEDVFARRGIEYVLLKGASHSPDFTPDPLSRTQGDIDLWCLPEGLEEARQALLSLGYRHYGRSEGRHLPPMIREREWRWRGDYFAPDLPIPVELHHRLWDEEFERIKAPGEQGFWERRVANRLALPDTLAFAALHLLMHVLHGDLRLQRAWEIAHFLELHEDDSEFWATWRNNHPSELRLLEALVFQLTADWFGAPLSSVAAQETKELPMGIRSWISRHALSPLEALYEPNKDEVWLQLCLVHRLRDQFAIVRRRLLPLGSNRSASAGELGFRLLHHARAFLPTLWSGVRWWWVDAQPGPGFLRFQAASALFCLGMSAYLLLFNLYLMQLGYGENLLGKVAGAMSVGTLLGALPAAAVTRRFGLRNTLLVAILSAAFAALCRVLNASPLWQLGLAFLHGLSMSLWAVSYSPAIAGLSLENRRRTAFSVACAVGMSIGILGGLVGGWLPGALGSKKTALLVAASLSAFGAVPAAGLRFLGSARESMKAWPRSAALGGFLAVLACWAVAVGLFNPFFNAYLLRLSMSTERIGLVYSGAQAAQAIAVLTAPLVLRRLGESKGVALMQLTTALALISLSSVPTAAWAVVAYTGYASVQYMSEPGILHMLMSRVRQEERSGASALYFLVTSIAASLAALVGGAAIARFGYPPMLVAAASIAALAAVLFVRLD